MVAGVVFFGYFFSFSLKKEKKKFEMTVRLPKGKGGEYKINNNTFQKDKLHLNMTNSDSYWVGQCNGLPSDITVALPLFNDISGGTEPMSVKYRLKAQHWAEPSACMMTVAGKTPIASLQDVEWGEDS